MDICERIARERRGASVVEIKQIAAARVEDAARLFGLFDKPDTYYEIDATAARSLLAWVLEKDMAGGLSLMRRATAERLANRFLLAFQTEGARYYTNSNFGLPAAYVAWCPATDCTIDSGVLVLTSRHTACAWFMDDD
ncbi:hypothetical protein [Pelomonas sp. KK5]|uniref:hypothetical protein n=1 Tax=Pelomonas sp. KK5 TaxID=1855730 RepID=UPI00097C81F1|nr:hypothetical protein [Pelomonas sp. KK5]